MPSETERQRCIGATTSGTWGWINTPRPASEDHHMLYRELALADLPTRDRLNTITLYLSDDQEWQHLDAFRRSYGPTEIIGRRELALTFGEWSVDVLCARRDEAAR